MADTTPTDSRIARTAREGLSTFAALVLTGIMLVSVVDVVGRYLFKLPLPGSSEITEILMAVLIYAGMPIVSLRRAHICVDLLDPVVPARIVPIRNAAIGIIGAVVLAIIAWRLWVYADQIRQSRDVTEYLKLPQAPVAYFLSVLAAIAAVIEVYRTFRPAASDAASSI